jgi:Tfp pilus assembly protein PilV
MRRNENGLTFAELIVTSFVLVTAITSALLFFTNAMLAAQYSRDITVATSHGEGLFEEMQSRPSLLNITGTSWPDWFTAQTLDKLPSEAVSVVYTNVLAVPLEITANVTWIRKARTYRETFVTRMKK